MIRLQIINLFFSLLNDAFCVENTYIASDGRMADEWETGEDSKENSRGLIEAQSPHFRGRLRKDARNPSHDRDMPAEIRTENFSNKRLKTVHHHSASCMVGDY
jgi:hypothetical protein